MSLRRRTFLGLLGVAATAAWGGVKSSHAARRASPAALRFLRPPGVGTEAAFLDQCIRCGQCGQVCPNRAIRYFGLQDGLASLDTPYIIPREQGCILCMKCGDICPSGAIPSVPREAEEILERVKMGQARVDERLCLSFQGKTCGVCYRACPLQDIALSVGMLEQPHVSSACVGCGLCERVCIQMPQAIRVFPLRKTV